MVCSLRFFDVLIWRTMEGGKDRSELGFFSEMDLARFTCHRIRDLHFVPLSFLPAAKLQV